MSPTTSHSDGCRLGTDYIRRARDFAPELAAGSTAIFEKNPFERRFRDIHTVSQQLQGRQELFETVGQYLLGLEPDSPAWL
jgi:indole-3-acetate monooxygenase